MQSFLYWPHLFAKHTSMIGKLRGTVIEKQIILSVKHEKGVYLIPGIPCYLGFTSVDWKPGISVQNPVV